ncbi:glycosyltransferase family 25 protein [Breoghania sp. L-A4]|uniref:glycosyltransferase family 25 protein n=1 Tax=Breoghania sp. L-A4 TaxID=2304600 RepID=UPI0013C2F9D3|nr:glycosyltransferase family 25 protein [Breoghania sp. L-A4]
MHIFVINMDRDVDRLAWMATELTRHSFDFERFPAVRGDALPDWLRTMFEDENGRCSAMTNGEVGCYASHLTIHRHIVERDLQGPVLVLEDDLRLNPDFGSFLTNLDALPADWDIVRLSNPPKEAFRSAARLFGDYAAVRYWRVPNNTGAYLINQRGARKFLERAGKRMRPVDEDLRRPWEHGLATYGVVPAPIESNIFDSTIDTIAGRGAAPARKRFKAGKVARMRGAAARLSYRLATFGVVDCLKCWYVSTVLRMLLGKGGRRDPSVLMIGSPR